MTREQIQICKECEYCYPHNVWSVEVRPPPVWPRFIAAPRRWVKMPEIYGMTCTRGHMPRNLRYLDDGFESAATYKRKCKDFKKMSYQDDFTVEIGEKTSRLFMNTKMAKAYMFGESWLNKNRNVHRVLCNCCETQPTINKLKEEGFTVEEKNDG